jgi:hypothetical protein
MDGRVVARVFGTQVVKMKGHRFNDAKGEANIYDYADMKVAVPHGCATPGWLSCNWLQGIRYARWFEPPSLVTMKGGMREARPVDEENDDETPDVPGAD